MKLNSSRVPGKNFKDLGGRSLFEWMLTKLLSIDSISKVIINTDAPSKILEYPISSHNKVQIHERDISICGDDVSMNKIISSDIKKFDADIYFMTHTTNPFLSTGTIESAIDSFISQEQYDSLFSVNKIQSRFYDKLVSPVNHDPGNLIPTQELDVLYEENSNFYLFTKDSFVASNHRIGVRPMMYVTPKLESLDIDNIDDWELAEALVKSKIFRI
ncbi:MAG: acylneuraminate cytidylyltransferase family protein [Gammaproteobacteria bacterium]|nr:acylneuraminate cytidylyltransferase family protein [Gammaproteobacteria bacterium]